MITKMAAEARIPAIRVELTEVTGLFESEDVPASRPPVVIARGAADQAPPCGGSAITIR